MTLWLLDDDAFSFQIFLRTAHFQQIQIFGNATMGDSLWRSNRGYGKCDQLVFIR